MNRHTWFIAQTYVNCKGEAEVSFYYSEKNLRGSYWSQEFNQPGMCKFTTEEEALEVADSINRSNTTVHGLWEEIK